LSSSRLAEDWISEYGPCLESVDSFVTTFGSTTEKQIIKDDLLLKIKLNRLLNELNGQYFAELNGQVNVWVELSAKPLPLRNLSIEREQSDMDEICQIINSTNIEQFTFTAHFVARLMTGNYQSMTQTMTGSKKVLPLEWHEQHYNAFSMAMDNMKKFIGNLKGTTSMLGKSVVCLK
jgi:hypothetical protein